MTISDRIYLDNAATTFPKPEAVYVAVDRYQRECGSAVGRGATRQATELNKVVDRCRSRAARLFDVKTSEVAFTYSGTDGLNTLLHGVLHENAHVVTSCWEHNSVLRPLRELERVRGVTTSIVPGDASGRLDLQSLKSCITTQTQLVVLTHASNVTGIIQPIAEVVELAHQQGALVLLDAAQSAGHIPFSVPDLNVDLLACSGHKGLLGPLGTGLLIVREHVLDQVSAFRQGGTGTRSESIEQPSEMPDKFEAGNHNAPGLVGLEAALAWLEDCGVENLARHERQLTKLLVEGLADVPGVNVLLPECVDNRVGVVSLTFDQAAPQVVSSLLDEHFQIETRAGLHCAPRAHQELGTADAGGTVRFSIGPFTTSAQLATTVEAVAQIAAAI